MTIACLLQFSVGGRLGINETNYQPMKIAAAEANWQTCQPCSFSVFQIGGYNQDEQPIKIIEIPHLLSLLATGTWDGEVQGLSELNDQYSQQFGEGYYVPNVFVQYWSMRAMAYIPPLLLLVGLWGMWLLRRKRFETSAAFLRVAARLVPAPFVMATAGWLLTESGRQPWIVQGLMLTKDGLSGLVVAFVMWTYVLARPPLWSTIVLAVPLIGSVVGAVLLLRTAPGAAGEPGAAPGGRAFAATAATIGGVLASLFAASYPDVLVSSTAAEYSLTVANSAAGSYSLQVITVVAAVMLPLVLLYQGWTYYVFRRRVIGPTIAGDPAPRPDELSRPAQQDH